MRERGLKQKIMNGKPFTLIVVPRAGTWIETYDNEIYITFDKSFPVRERGLKPVYLDCEQAGTGRSPCGNVD